MTQVLIKSATTAPRARGRPALPSEVRCIKKSVSLRPTTYAALLSIGDQCLSRGIEEAVKLLARKGGRSAR